MYEKMRSWLGFRKKKSTPAFPAYYSETASLHAPIQRLAQKGSLLFPTSLDQVAATAHRCAPSQLPGEEATEDDVRYFLYQILTHKEHEVIRSSPQWILETCMSWHGGGNQLRSLPFDGFQQLCPLNRGHANIDWTKRGSRFKLQEMPPCGTRDLIGQAVRTVVTHLKAKENGHRGPGWQDSNDLRRPSASQSTECLTTQSLAPSIRSDIPLPSSAAVPTYPVRNQFYSFSNHSLPQFHSTPSLHVYQDPPLMQQGTTCAQSEYKPSVVEPVNQPPSLDSYPQLSPDDEDYHRHSPLVPSLQSPLFSPALSYAYSDSASSQVSESTRLSQSTQCSASTARTSPPSSEDENSHWTSKINRPCSISQLITDGQYSLPETYQATSQRTSTGAPIRYKLKSNPRSFDPQLHMAHLRNPSYAITALPQSSLALSHVGTDKYDYRRDPAMSPETNNYSLRRDASLRPSSRSNYSRSAMARTNSNAPRRGSTPPTLATAAPVTRSRTVSAPPSNDYGLDAFAFDTAEKIGCKSRPGLIRSMTVDQGKKLKRGKSENVFHTRGNNYGTSGSGEESVGPHIRFHDPQTGVPRLTMIETIDQHQQLGKQRLEGQRHVEIQSQQSLKTVYETIEEQEIFHGKPQRGMDSVQHGWASYL